MAGSLIKSMENPWPIFRDIVLIATKHRAVLCFSIRKINRLNVRRSTAKDWSQRNYSEPPD